MKKNKRKLVFNYIKALTLIMPMVVYLFLSATLFNIKPDIIIGNINIEQLSIVPIEDEYFIYDTDYIASFDGVVEYNHDLGIHGIYITSDDIIKVKRNYYSYIEDDGVFVFKDIKRFVIQKETSYKLPVVFFISLIGVVFVGLFMQKKMSIHKTYPKAAVLIGLTSGTVITYILQALMGGIANVFLIATISWAAFMLEEYIQHKNDEGKTEEAQEAESLLEMLKKAASER